MITRKLVVNGLLAAAVAGVAVGAYRSTGTSNGGRSTVVTATATRGIVLASVSATGNVTTARQLGLNIVSGGLLTELNVKPGDRVATGQVLARADGRAASETLATSQANLASATARLAQDLQGVTPQQRAQDRVAADQSQTQIGAAATTLGDVQSTAAQDLINLQAAVDQAGSGIDAARATAAQNTVGLQTAVDQAGSGIDAARATAAQNAVGLQTAVDQAGAQQSADQAQRNADAAQLAADQAKLAADQAAQAAAQAEYDADSANVAQDQADQQGCAANPPTPPARSANCSDVPTTLQQDQADQQASASRLNDAKQVVNADQGTVSSSQAKVAGDDARLLQDSFALTNTRNAQAAGTLRDQQAITAAQNALTNARNAQAAGTLRDQQAITAAQTGLRAAQLSLQATLAGNAVKEAPALAVTLAADRAAVASAQASVGTAQRALSDTTLVAPADGTVVSVANAVGEFVSGGGGGSASGSGTSPSAFIVLRDLATLQVQAGFSEADAAKVAVGQPANVTFDALPEERVAGRVVAVDTAATVVSNVVTYNVTVLLSKPVAAVKPGMTAAVQVVVAERDRVVKVPNVAVTTRAGTPVVTVQAGGASVVRSVVAGLRGDDATEIVTGLKVGDRVVTSQGAVGGEAPGGEAPGGEGGGGIGGIGGIGGGGGGGHGGGGGGGG